MIGNNDDIGFCREKIEVILQETLFEPRNLLEQTVAEAMSQTLEVRDAILQRTKDIRTGEGDITICPDQGVNQEQFLSLIRMDVMTVLLSLIEQDAASTEKLKVILTYLTYFVWYAYETDHFRKSVVSSWLCVQKLMEKSHVS